MKSLLEGYPPAVRAVVTFAISLAAGLAFVRLVHGDRDIDAIVMAGAVVAAARAYYISGRKT